MRKVSVHPRLLVGSHVEAQRVSDHYLMQQRALSELGRVVSILRVLLATEDEPAKIDLSQATRTRRGSALNVSLLFLGPEIASSLEAVLDDFTHFISR